MPILNSDPANADYLSYLLKSNPQYKDLPGVATAVASSGPSQGPNPTELSDQMSGFGYYVNLKKNIESMAGPQQVQAVQSLDPVSRSVLGHMGYKMNVSPEEVMAAQKSGVIQADATSFSLLGSVRHAAAKVIHPFTWLASQPLHAIGWAGGYPLRALQHGYRAAIAGASVNSLRGGGMNHVFVTPEGETRFSQIDFGSAWRITQKGETTLLDPDRISTNLDDTMKKVVQGMVLGIKDDQLVQEYGLGALQNAIHDPEAQKYARALEDTKISGGRMAAYNLGLKFGSKPFKLTSGLTDMGIDVALDKYTTQIGLGKLSEALRGTSGIAKLVKDGDYISKAYEVSPAFRRASQFIADNVNNAKALTTAFPRMQPEVLDYLVKAAPQNGEEVRDLLRSFADTTARAEGAAAKAGMVSIPTMTSLGPMRTLVKMKAQDFLTKLATIDPEEAAKHGITASLSGQREIGAVARGLRNMTNLQIPLNVERAGLDVSHPNSIKWYERLLSYGNLHSAEQSRLLTDYIEADPASRATLLQSTYNTVAESTARLYGKSLDSLPVLREYMDTINERLGNQIDHVKAPVSLADAQNATKYVVPNFRKMIEGVRSTNLLSSNPTMKAWMTGADSFMNNVWRPGVLLRLGFPVRVAMEEAAREMISEGWGSVPKGIAGEVYARAKLKGTQATARLIGGEGSKLAQIRDYISTYTHAAMRGTAAAFLPDEYTEAATAALHLNGVHIAAPGISAHHGELSEADRMVDKALRDGHDLSPYDLDYASIKGFDSRFADERYLRAYSGLHQIDSPEVHDALPTIKTAIENSRTAPSYTEVSQEATSKIMAARDMRFNQMSHEESVLWNRVVGQGTGYSTAARNELGEKLANNANYQRVVQYQLKESGVPDKVLVWRGVHPGEELEPYTSASLSHSQAVGFAGESGTVTPLYINREDIVGVGSSGEGEVFIKTANAKTAPPAPSGKVDINALEASVRDRVREYYNSEEARPMLQNHPNIKMTTARRTVLPPGATPAAGDLSVTYDDALNQMARRTAHRVVSSFFDKNGNPVENLLDKAMAEGKMPTGLWLMKNIQTENLPSSWWRPVLKPKYSSLEKFTTFGFRKVGDLMDMGSRNPIYIHELAKSIKELRAQPGVEDFMSTLGDEAGHRWLWENADTMARRNLEGLLHDPNERSLFSQMHRTAIPFQFAQEQFLKRWAKTFARDPVAARRAQLGMMGLRSSGILHKDDQGNEYFIYPGSHLAVNTINRAVELVTGSKVHMPIPINFTGKVDYLIPGVDRPLMPSFGPFVALGMQTAAARIPEMKSFEKFLLGPSSGKSWWENFTPTVVKNIIKTATTGADVSESTGEFQTAMIEATNWLMANPKTAINEQATPAQMQEFRDRAVETARHVLTYRAMFGFMAPASPQINYYNSLSPEWRRILKDSNGDIHAAAQAFHQAHPDANLYTTFATYPSARGTDFPATPEVGDWIDQHKAVINKYGPAATYFLPFNPNGQFDQAAYAKEIAVGLRRRRNVEPDGKSVLAGDTMWEQAQINADAPTYYAMRDQYEQALPTLHGDARQALQNYWAAVKDNYLKTRPVFAAYLQNASSRGQERQQILDQTEAALKDPSVPRNEHTDALETVVKNYAAMNQYLESIKDHRDAQSSYNRQQVQEMFAAWGAGLDDPVAKMFFDNIIRPELQGVSI